MHTKGVWDSQGYANACLYGMIDQIVDLLKESWAHVGPTGVQWAGIFFRVHWSLHPIDVSPAI